MKQKFTEEEARELREIGDELREARKLLGLTQEGWAKIFNVTTNTMAQWERGALKASGANRRKIMHIKTIIEDPKVVQVIRDVLTRADGVPATSAIFGMIFGIIEASGLGYEAVELMLKPGSTLVNAVKALANRNDGF